MRHLVIGLIAAIAVAGGCGGIELNPVTNDRRTVRFEQDASKTLTVIRDMVFDDKSRHPANELRFPAGVYVLEAEDEDYYYMRSGAPLQLIEFRPGGKQQLRSLHGGIAIGKFVFRAVPAAAYLDGEGSGLLLVWKLSKPFLGREGKDWKKSF